VDERFTLVKRQRWKHLSVEKRVQGEKMLNEIRLLSFNLSSWHYKPTFLHKQLTRGKVRQGSPRERRRVGRMSASMSKKRSSVNTGRSASVMSMDTEN
jgi:hypothetical protein